MSSSVSAAEKPRADQHARPVRSRAPDVHNGVQADERSSGSSLHRSASRLAAEAETPPERRFAYSRGEQNDADTAATGALVPGGAGGGAQRRPRKREHGLSVGVGAWRGSH